MKWFDSIKNRLARFTQAVLAFDGVLHFLEVLAAYKEEAWITFTLTSFHSLVFVSAFILVGHACKHPEIHEEVNNGLQ